MPPETVKDSLALGRNVPQHYIVPMKRFDKNFCMSVCEFEFPAYFSFFVNGGKKINLICTPEEEQCIKNVFQETLLGPTNFADFLEDFDMDIDKDLIPKIQDE